jgi:PRTRC genetic system protein A
MKPVGYLTNTKQGQEGEPGLFFDYVLAANGLFVQANGPLVRATVLISEAVVRGLLPLQEKVELTKGKIPKYIYDLAIGALCADPYGEKYLAVVWDGAYRLKLPGQQSGNCSVEYERLESTILDIHSHATMSSFFSWTDNQDEQGLRLYMVVGKLDMLMPEVKLRVGVYGYFAPLEIKDAFDV